MSTFGSYSADIEDGSSKQQRSATSEVIDTEDEIRLNESTVRKRACTFKPSDIKDGALKRKRAAEDEDDSSTADEDDSSAEDVDSSTDYINLSSQEKEKLNTSTDYINLSSQEKEKLNTSTDYVNLSSQEKEKLNTSTDYVNLSSQEKEKLNTFFEKIVTKAGVDFSSSEIQDIQSAVSEMIGRIKTWINERGVFSISHTELCGSMAEKTAIWKHNVFSEEPFIEFVFLAVLQAACDIERGCPECFRVNYTLPANLDMHGLLKQYYPSSYDLFLKGKYSIKAILEECFTRETNNCLASCGCLKVLYPDPGECIFEPSSTCSDILQGCDKCTVDKPTGTLRVKTPAKIGGLDGELCSLIFDWTSKAKTLSTRDQRCLPKAEKMNNLTIHIDFLPALELFQSKQKSAEVAACSSSDLVLNPTNSEYDHYRFLVPKNCVKCVCDESGCKDTWQGSGCRAEIVTIVNKMSDRHRKCYQVLKYLIDTIGMLGVYLTNYQLKTAVLHHNRSCSDTSEDCAECVFKVIDELLHAYETGHLKSLHSQANLLEQDESDFCDIVSNCMSALGKAICSAVPESGLLPLLSFLDKVENARRRILYK